MNGTCMHKVKDISQTMCISNCSGLCVSAMKLQYMILKALFLLRHLPQVNRMY